MISFKKKWIKKGNKYLNNQLIFKMIYYLNLIEKKITKNANNIDSSL